MQRHFLHSLLIFLAGLALLSCGIFIAPPPAAPSTHEDAHDLHPHEHNHEGHVHTPPSNAQADSLHLDSIAHALAQRHLADSATQHLDSAQRQLLDSAGFAHLLDSLRHTLRRDTVIAISNRREQDTPDTTRAKGGIESPVDYVAKDSLVYDAETGLMYLYGQAKVNYQRMELTAERITMNMDSSLVHAVGAQDSVGGEWKGQPIYKQGSENYESERMSFNFKTKKGFIQNVKTTQGEGYLRSVDSKRSSDGYFYLQNAKYTTCDADCPHFYLQLTRAKVSPGKETFFGPAYLVVADVPLPLAIPYGFFPFNKSYSSGLIMPTYGDETARGFYLRDGGYYFAISDRLDLKLLGEIYTKGSWGLSAESNYARRYKYRGNVYFSYITTVEGEKNMPDYSKTTNLKVQWSHSSDAKANPNTSFSARVNFASQGYERSNLQSQYTPLAYTQSTRASSVSFSHNIPSLGISLSGSGNITQNMRDSSLAVTLPDLSLTVARFYPFRRKKVVGSERWYEKISMSYTASMSNSINTKESELFKKNLIKDWRNGIQHRLPIDATFQLFKYINVSPSISFSGRTYMNRTLRSWDEKRQVEVADTTYGFYNLYDWNTSISANTTLYGFYKPWRKLFGDKIQAIRHVFKPSVSFSYAPDFTAEHYGYTQHYVKTDADGKVSTVSYSPYQNALYGYPSGTTQGSVNLSFSNNVEMKIKSLADTTGYRKISIIDEFSGNISYNLAAKTRQWSDLSLRVRLRFPRNYTFSLAAQFATYAYQIDDAGNISVGDRTEWSYGRFGRFQGMSQNFSYTLNNEKLRTLLGLLVGRGWDKIFKRTEQGEGRGREGNATEDDEALDDEEANTDPMLRKNKKVEPQKKVKAEVDDDGYLPFSMPWNLSFSYGISMREDTRKEKFNRATMRYPYGFTHSLNMSGNIQLAKGWNISFSSGYDFNYHKLSMTTASLSRDLHCFEMSCNVVLLPYSSFNFSFRARAAELADALKYEKRSSYSSNVNWY